MQRSRIRALTVKEAAAYIRMSESFLNNARSCGSIDAPPFVKIGRAVRYLKEDLDQWLESRRCHSTIEAYARQGRA